MLTQSLQDNMKMLFMFLLILGVDQDVIIEFHDKLVQLWYEYRIHQVHEMAGSMGKPKRHDQILIKVVSVRECHFRNVLRTDLDLMIT
jgi:hypothetical protein